MMGNTIFVTQSIGNLAEIVKFFQSIKILRKEKLKEKIKGDYV